MSLNVTVECAAVARATWRQVSRPVAGRPQLTTMRCVPCDNSNDRQPACASWLTLNGGGATGIHDHQQVVGFEALIAGVRRVSERCAARVVVGEDGGDQIRRGRAHAVEVREVAVAVPEEAQHRHHAVDGVVERGRRRDVARGERLSQRQEIEQQFDQRAGIAADVAAVGQDLAVELGRPDS